MQHSSTILGAALVAAGLLTGCSDSSSDLLPPGPEALSASVVEIALEADRMVDDAVGIEMDAMGAVSAASSAAIITDERSFSRSRTCPAGGTFAVEGSMVRTIDTETRTMELEASGGSAATDCAFLRNDLTVTVNGSSEWDAFRRRVDGAFDGPQTSHHAGSWTVVRSDGQERSCSYDFSVVRDPETRTRTVEGTMCDESFRRVVSWTPGA
jgi:hypothetical protein